MKLTDIQIKEIYENLDSGMRCFYNLKTAEIEMIPDFDNWMDPDEELWQEEIKAVEENPGDYFEFIRMDSNESFQIMADFTENLNDTDLQKKLIFALKGRKPFQNFKWQIDNSGEVRQQWFDYKERRYIKWVEDQIDSYNNNFE